MRKSRRVGSRQLGSKRRNAQGGSNPWSDARSCLTWLRRWRRWGSRRVGPQCPRESYREFRCGRADCRRWVQICSCCDRGQRYCGLRCAQAARRESQRRSQLEYEQKPEAKLLRAARQKRYRARLALAASRPPEPGEPPCAVAERDPGGPAPSPGGSAAEAEEAQDRAVAMDAANCQRVDPYNVTHQGCLGSACVSQWRASRVASLGPRLFLVRCCFCGAWCRPERRRGPLRGRQRRRLHPLSRWIGSRVLCERTQPDEV